MKQPEDELDRWRAFIGMSKWIFAKTYAKFAPHEYTLLKQTHSSNTFLEFARFIERHGYKEKFGKREYTYVNIDGWKYWTMDPTPEQTDLINRARIKP
jgi:hypothetical protein